MERKESNFEDKLKIKTICDYLFCDHLLDNASFRRFELCFQHLFNNINISLEKVFNDICGENKKYITYQRFLNAYYAYIKRNKRDLSEDTKIFFDILFKSILKGEGSCVGKFEKNRYTSTTKTIASRSNCITMVQILHDKNENIRGMNLEYDNIHKSKMYPKSIENELFISLELTLKYIDEHSEIEENKKKYPLINKDYSIDAITHIFGTFDEKSGYITFIGFKCISGKTVFDGNPKGDGFLFGQFGNKLHDIKVQITKEGITRLEPGFKSHLRKNICLEKADEFKDDEVKEEGLLTKIKDEDKKEKFITTRIIDDDYFFNENLKDEYSGKDYKEVIDQYPRKWILKESLKRIDENQTEENKNDKLTLDDYLDEYNKELNKSTIILNKIKSSFIEPIDNDVYKAYDSKSVINVNYMKKDDINFPFNNWHKTKIYKPNEKKINNCFESKKEKELNLNNNKSDKKDGEKDKLIMKFDKKFSYLTIPDDNIKDITLNKADLKRKIEVKMTTLTGKVVILGKKDNILEKFWKGRKKIYIHLLIIIGGAIKAKNILENKKQNISFEEKLQLYKLLEKNEKLLFLIPNNIKALQKEINEINEKEEEQLNEPNEQNLLIPDSNIKNASLAEFQININNCKDLLLNQKIKEKSKKNKIEKLLIFYIKQKNILIEKETDKAKEEIIKGLNVNNYIENETKKRDKAKEKEQNILKEKMKKKEDDMKNNSGVYSQKKINLKESISTRKISTKIFHNQVMIGRKQKDKDFPPNKNSLCPYDEKAEEWIYFEGLKKKYIDGWDKYDWCKIEEITDFKNNYEIFEEGATIEDIVQGDINDCYFLSAIGSLCSDPHFFEKIFHIKNKSEEHVYGIYLFLNAKWKLVLVDDYFPYEIVNLDEKKLCFGSSVQKELWVSLLEKAWAKVNGSYARIGCRGFMNEAFDVLTEAYTEEIYMEEYINETNNRKEILWRMLMDYFDKKYVITAGTIDEIEDEEEEEIGLVSGHAYTLIKKYLVETDDGEERLVKLKNPYGDLVFSGDWNYDCYKWTDKIKKDCKYDKNEEKYGIFYMSFDDFCKYFDLINVAKLEDGYQTTYCKIKKNQAIKCQIIRLIIKEENTHVYIQLYRKNPRIIKKDKTYHSRKVMCFLVLVDEDFKYMQSTTGRKSFTGTHICIEAKLKPGTYYIFSDVNYRNKNNYDNHGYMITFYSNHKIVDFENVTERVADSILALEISMYYYCQMKKIQIEEDESGIKIFDSQKSNKEIPFRILCFVNVTKNPLKVELNIENKNKNKDKKNYCIYNNKIASEFDNGFIREIGPRNATTVLILENNLECKYNLKKKILDGNDERTYENTHPVFKNENEEIIIDDKGYLKSYYSKVNDGNGFIFGLENTGDISFELNLTLKEAYDIDSEFIGKENIDFKIPPKSKKVFNVKIKSDAKDPSLVFTKSK